MKKYFIYFNLAWQSFFAYRANLILQFAGQVIFYISMVILWLAVYESKDVIGDYTKEQMITYIVGSGIISGYIFYVSIGDQIDMYINRGLLSGWLTKPMNVPNMWFTDDLARRFFNITLSVIVFSVVFVIFHRYLYIQTDIFIILGTIIIVFLAGIINFLIFYISGLLGFWMEETWGVRFVLRMFQTIAGGSIIPLSLFPGIVGKILLILPTKYLFYTPMQFYLGKIELSGLPIILLSELAWIVTLAALGKLVWTKGLKHYTAVGA